MMAGGVESSHHIDRVFIFSKEHEENSYGMVSLPGGTGNASVCGETIFVWTICKEQCNSFATGGVCVTG